MSYVFATICLALMALSLMLIVLGLPGIWVIIGLAGLWAAFAAPESFGWSFFLLVIGLAVVGEVAEFMAGHFGSKKYGGSSKGSLGGMIGAIAGAILGAPLFFGLGALFGALAGAYIGCFTMEKAQGTESRAAARAAFGATLGRFGGFVIKFGIGVAIIWLSFPRVWPGA